MGTAAELIANKGCSKCLLQFPATLEHFSPHKMGRFGLHPYCRSCKRADDTERRLRPDQKLRQKQWRDRNKQTVLRHNLEWRAKNKSTPYVRRWRAENIEWARQQERERQKRYRAEPAKRLLGRVRARVAVMIAKGGRRTVDLLGYNADQLREHIQRCFTKGMTWESFGQGKIHIDHIVPVSSFNIEEGGIEELRRCWALSNLRPLWSHENLAKGAKRLFLL